MRPDHDITEPREIPPQPRRHVAVRHPHHPRHRQQRRVVLPPAPDFRRAEARAAPHQATPAARLVGLAAIHPRTVHQIDPRADRQIIVHGELEGQAQRVDQPGEAACRVAAEIGQMVKPDLGHAERPQKLHQPAPAERHRLQRRQIRHLRMAEAHDVRPPTSTGRAARHQHHPGTPGGQPGDLFVDMLARAAAERMGHDQHIAPPARVATAKAPQPLHIDGPAQRRHRVGGDKPLDRAGVARMAPLDHPHGGGHSPGPLVAERNLPAMAHEHVASDQVAQADPDRAAREVVLLAIAAPEGGLVQHPDRVQRVAPHVSREADTGRRLDPLPGIDPRGDAVKLGPTHLQPLAIVGIEARIAADRAVVGQRRHRGHVRGRISSAAQPVEPVAADLGIGVQPNHVAAAIAPHPGIDRRDETQIARLHHQLDQPAPRQQRQIGAQPRLRPGVVDHDQRKAGPVRRLQHAGEAAQRLRPATIDRDDDVNLHRHLDRSGALRRNPSQPCQRQRRCLVVRPGSVRQRPPRRVPRLLRLAPQPLLRPQSPGAPQCQVVRQRADRIARRQPRLTAVAGLVEPGVRVAPLGPAMAQVMGQRVGPRHPHIRVALQIERPVEQRLVGGREQHPLHRRHQPPGQAP